MKYIIHGRITFPGDTYDEVPFSVACNRQGDYECFSHSLESGIGGRIVIGTVESIDEPNDDELADAQRGRVFSVNEPYED